MLKDIISFTSGADMQVAQSEAQRAANILQTQVGSLEYAPLMGIDLKFFLESEFRIQNASFKAYLVQALLEQRINVINVVDVVESLFARYTFSVGASEQSEGTLIS